MSTATIPDPAGFIESRFGVHMKRKTRSEWAGPCPWCGGDDRFIVWARGNYMCRPATGHCGRSGWLDELDGQRQLSRDELVELRLSALERKQEEHERRLSALEQMHASSEHLLYHENLNTNVQAVDYWLSEGMTAETIARYVLGFCLSCPTAPGYASYTIPVMYQGRLYNIRHRLAKPNAGGKYRPHMAGLPTMIFNADDLHTDSHDILILEGEKKSLIVGQETGHANIATMGKQAFRPSWVKKLDKFSRVYVCYDPDAKMQAVQTAQLFGKRGRVVDVPVKADDFFVRYGGTASQFESHLSTARVVA